MGGDMNDNQNYWIRKIQFFLHDPIDKMIRIQGHEERAKRIADVLGETTPGKNEVIRADVVAAGLDRASLPGHSNDPLKDGSVDYAKRAFLTHPVSPCLYNLGDLGVTAKDTTKAIIQIIEEDIKDKVWDKQKYFNYLYFILRKRLVSQNAAGLGSLWDKLPADSRIPDHSIFNHNSMVSALGTCFTESEEKNASLVVFSIAPVQPFIAKARKLKDHWVASVILSWLAFEGIFAVVDHLGPDHVLYPSLSDQPLLASMFKCRKDYDFAGFVEEYDNVVPLKKYASVASLPNKIVFLAPQGQEEKYTGYIKERIEYAWLSLTEIVEKYIFEIGDITSPEVIKNIFKRQAENYWNLDWSCSKLVSVSDRKTVEKLFDKEKFDDVFDTVQAFSKIFPAADTVYQVSHSLSQTALAVSKSRPHVGREGEPGEKCPVCGEFEILHSLADAENKKAAEYKTARNDFWASLRTDQSTVKEDERLCALCAIKRFTPFALQEFGRDHILYSIFKKHDFPSTTEMAHKEFIGKLEAQGLIGDNKSLLSLLIDELHDREENELSPAVKGILKSAEKKGIKRNETDKYYAVLVMDGDKMGDLVNGETLSAEWKDVIHPDLCAKLRRNDFQKSIWERYLDKRRLLSPVAHTAISDALATFSLYAVPHVVNEMDGRLIYAGGDDVAAILPLSTVFDAVSKITGLYKSGFVRFSSEDIMPVKGCENVEDHFSFLLGGGEKITISGAVLICHHKQPLRGAIEDAHKLLKTVAKEKHDRNAFAVKLLKRSGQARVFSAGWSGDYSLNIFAEDQCSQYESFKEIINAIKKEYLSSSLVYRIKDLETAIFTLIDQKSFSVDKDKTARLRQLIGYEIEHSGLLNKAFPGKDNKSKRRFEALRLAGHIAGVILSWNPWKDKQGEWEFNGDTPIIAAFLSKGGV